MDDARALLDSLMGGDRNVKADERRVRKFTDDDNCRHFLVGLCPHDLFNNTKHDLGPCERQHDDFVKEMFEADADNLVYRRKWRKGLRVVLKNLLDGVDRRITLNQSRLEREKSEGDAQKVSVGSLKDDVSEKLRQAEQAASDGKYEESRRLMKDTEEIQKRMEEVESKSAEFTRQSCDICGLIIDAQEAEDMQTGRGWHTNGKQHQGYQLIRSKLVELEKQHSQDKKDGIRTPSPSPIKVTRPEVRRRKSPSPSRGHRKEDMEGRRQRKPSTSKSRARKEKAPEDRKRKSSRSRSREKGQERRKDGKRRAPSPIKKRSRSRKQRRSRSNGKQCERSKNNARSRSRKKRSRSKRSRSDEKRKKSRAKSRSRDPSLREEDDRGSRRDLGAEVPEAPKRVDAPPKEPPPPPPASVEEVVPEFELPKMPVRFVLGFRRTAG